ncbi:MAG TPA: TraB/GumN family protein [Rhizomicrobium sp.]|nr:TraB/GumN family protein [Rhizomicrobium sp.]
MRRILLAAIVLAACCGARADEPQREDWSPNIETVIVTAHEAGPLIWRVSDGDSTVYLLGVVEPVPDGLEWNDAGVRAALKGARELLLPPKASVGLVEGLWFLLWHSSDVYLPSDTPMESTLPEALRIRFETARNQIRRDAGRYARLRPPLAGLRLEADFLKARDLTADEPGDTLRGIARRFGVSSRPIADYGALPMLRQLPTMSRAANEGCLKALLDDIDAIRARARPAAEAWAKGDLPALETYFSEQRFESCIEALPSFAALAARSANDSLSAVRASLAKPGKTVIALSVGALLRRNGVLDRLEAAGFKVQPPGS